MNDERTTEITQNASDSVGIGHVSDSTINFNIPNVGKSNDMMLCSACGINRIYANCYETRTIIVETIKSAEEFFFFALIGDAFTKNYKDFLKNAMRRGLDSKLLIAKPESLFLKEQWELCGLELQEADVRMRRFVAEWKQIVSYGKGRGSAEIRCFSTELRNQLVMFKKYDGTYIAWVSVSMPPLRGMDSIQLEITDSGMIDNCLNYFNNVWNFHKDDRLL